MVPKRPPVVFVSYTHTDRPVAVEIATVLKAYSIPVWLDEWKIVLGDSIEGEIDAGLRATHFIFLISKNTRRSKYQKREFRSSLSGFINKGRPKIIPVMLGKVRGPNIIQDLKRHRWEGGTKHDWEAIIGSITRKLPEKLMAKAIIDLYKKTVFDENPEDQGGAWYPFGYKVCPNCGSDGLDGSSFPYEEDTVIEVKCKECGWNESEVV